VPNDHVMSGVWNFRDIAEETGTRPGRFFSSSELSALDDAGRTALLGFGITAVADLRSDREVERRGAGQVPDGVAIHHLPFQEPSAPGADAPHEQSFQRMLTKKPADEDVSVAARRFMAEEYQRFPTMPGAQLAVRQVISLLVEEHPVLTHCFAGKDRTGFVVAMTLEAVGVERDAILSDFLRSNDAVPQLRKFILEPALNGDAVEARLTEEVLGVREEYLEQSGAPSISYTARCQTTLKLSA
jgi:protein-tyrosine phosphatase